MEEPSPCRPLPVRIRGFRSGLLRARADPPYHYSPCRCGFVSLITETAVADNFAGIAFRFIPQRNCKCFCRELRELPLQRHLCGCIKAVPQITSGKLRTIFRTLFLKNNENLPEDGKTIARRISKAWRCVYAQRGFVSNLFKSPDVLSFRNRFSSPDKVRRGNSNS